MSLRLRCPECGSSVRLPDNRRDRRNYCPRCDAELPRASRDQAGGNSGAVVALVLGLVFAGGVAVLGCGAALWLLVPAKNPPVAQAPAPQAAPDGGGVRIAPPDPEPGERLAPRMPDVGDPPLMKGDAPFAPAQGALPGPGVKEPELRRPPVARPDIRVPATPPRPALKPPVLTERKSVSLPDATERVLTAGGGRYLVCHFPKLRNVGVFDLEAMTMVRFINLAEDKPMLATGMTKLVVYLPSAKLIQRYDLLTGNREANQVFDVPDVKAIAVGSASAGPLVVSAVGGGRLFDLEKLTEMEVPPDEVRDRVGGDQPPGPKRLPFRGDKLTAAANGRLFIGSGDYQFGAISIEGNQVKFNRGFGDWWVYCKPSADGKYVFRAGHGAVTADGQKTEEVVYSQPGGSGHAGYFFLPAEDGPFYFHAHFGDGLRGHEPRFQKDPQRAVTVYMYGLDMPLARVLDVKDLRDWSNVNQPGLPYSEHVRVIPRANLMVTIGSSRDRMTLIPLDLNQALEELGVDFLLVKSSPPGTYCPGNEVRYPIRAKSKAGGLKYTLESGPDGMKVGADGMLSWNVPPGFTVPEVAIIVGIKDAAGKEAFHSFCLTKSNTPEPYHPEPERESAKVASKAEAKADGPRTAYRLPPLPKALELGTPELGERTEVRIPEKFDRVVAAGGGRFLVLHAISTRRAFVFDVSTGKVARAIELGEDRTLLAAGLTQLLVYRPSDNSVETFTLATGASAGRKVIPTRAVTEMVMGSASAGPLHVRSAERAELYDVETLLPMELPKADGFPFFKGPVWASADGRTFANTLSRATGSFTRLATLRSGSIAVTTELVAANYAVPGHDGTTVYLAGYGELTSKLEQGQNNGRPITGGSDPAYHFLPVPGGMYFLVLHAGVAAPPYHRGLKETQNGVSVFHREQRRTVATVDGVAEMTADLREDPALPSLVHFHPDTQVLVTVPRSHDRLVLYPVKVSGGSFPTKKAIAWKLPDIPPPAQIKAGVVKDRTTLDLPGRVMKVVLGGGGRFVVYMVDYRKLLVLDLNEAKVVREITTEHQIVSYTAGMTKLVLVEQVPDGRVLWRYDLATGKREATSGLAGNPDAVVMGSGSAGPVLVAGGRGVTFYDLANLAPIQADDRTLTNLRLNPSGMAAAANGRVFLARTRGTGASRVVVLSLTANGVQQTAAASPSTSGGTVSADGRHVFLGQGIYTADLKNASDVVWSPDFSTRGKFSIHFVPAADGGPYYLHLHLGLRQADPKFADDPQYGVTIYKYGQDKPVGRLPSVIGPTRTTAEWFGLGPAGVYQFVPSAKLLVGVDPGLTKVHLIPVDPENIPRVADPDPWPEPAKPAPSPPPKKAPASTGGRTVPMTPGRSSSPRSRSRCRSTRSPRRRRSRWRSRGSLRKRGPSLC